MGSRKEETVVVRFVKVARKSRLPEGGKGTYVEVEGHRITLFNPGGEIHALDDACTHVGGPLSQGFVEEGEVECPWYGSRFDIKTGEVRIFPAREDVATYKVRVTGNDVEVEI
jgi:nitrite reductase/ring-hydroxylating ferredoxin subunit